MDLILWRHAEAEDGVPDLARALSDKGRAQAAAMARWLAPRLPVPAAILVSPARRAQETALALKRAIETRPELGPGADPAQVLKAAGWPKAKGAVVVVGHQPTLGEVASLVLAGVAAPWGVKKAGVWWLTHRVRDDEAQTLLRVVLAPEFL